MTENLYLPPTEAEIEQAITESSPSVAVTIKRLVNDRQRLLTHPWNQTEGDHRHQLDFQFARESNQGGISE